MCASSYLVFHAAPLAGPLAGPLAVLLAGPLAVPLAVPFDTNASTGWWRLDRLPKTRHELPHSAGLAVAAARPTDTHWPATLKPSNP